MLGRLARLEGSPAIREQDRRWGTSFLRRTSRKAIRGETPMAGMGQPTRPKRSRGFLGRGHAPDTIALPPHEASSRRVGGVCRLPGPVSTALSRAPMEF